MDYSKLNKQKIINEVISNKISFNSLSKKLKNDKEVVLSVMRSSSHIRDNMFFLAGLSNDLKDDKEIVLEAVKQSGRAIRYASERLRNDKLLLTEAVKENGYALYYASDKLKDDKELVLEAIKNNIWAIDDASKRLQEDKDILELLEKIGILNTVTNWAEHKRELLANIREKEKMENYITKSTDSTISTKKVKF